MAREAAEAAMAASYERGVKDTEARLTEEVAVVCRDYCTKSWGVAMDRAGVPADSELRRIENIFFPEDIREIPDSDPLEKLLSALIAVPDLVVPEGKGADEEAQPLAKISHLRTPSQSKMLSRGPRVLNLNPKPDLIIPRLMASQKAQPRIKPRILA